MSIIQKLFSIETFSNTISNTFSIKGRASRLVFWNYQLLAGVILGGTSIMLSFLNNIFLNYLFLTLLLLSVVSSFTLGIRRLHDLNKSGWFSLINLIPFIGGLIYLVYIGFFPSVNEGNNYGEEDQKEDKKEDNSINFFNTKEKEANR